MQPLVPIAPVAPLTARSPGRQRRRAVFARRTILVWLATTIALTLAAIALFALVPRLDLVVSDLFAGSGQPFPAKDIAFWQWIRTAMITATDGLVAVALILLAAGAIVARLRFVRPVVLGFILAVYAAVPGVLVNLLIKPFWGRARPRNIVEYGGTAHYTPPFQIADQCGSACSFVSGETSALFTVATLAVLLFVPSVPERLRPLALTGIGFVAIVGSGLRIAFGGHFLSDVVFGALISVAVTLMLYLLSGLHRLDSPFLPRQVAANGRNPKARDPLRGRAAEAL